MLFFAPLIPAAISAGLGVGQLIGGMLMRPKRPEYRIPAERLNRMALRQQALNARNPAFMQAEQNIRQSGESAIQNIRQGATNSASLLAAAGSTQGTQNRSFRNLSAQEANDYYRRLQGLEAAQESVAASRDKAFEINELQPYLDKSKTKAALIQGGLTNLHGAAMDAGALAGQNYYMQQMGGPMGFNQMARQGRRSPMFGPINWQMGQPGTAMRTF